MNPRPLPDHGTYARANGSPGYRKPCYCDPCVIVKRRARKRSKVNRALGRSRLTPATAARQHLTHLHATMAWSAISAATGIDDRSLCRIYSGRREQITRTTEARILAVRAGEPSPGQFIDATGTIRRIQALMADGHSGRVIAAAADTTQARIHRISASKQSTVRRSIATRVEDAYERLSGERVEDNHFTRRVRNDAARKGWRDVQWWEDYGRIDDPDFNPFAVVVEETEFRAQARLRREEIIHLAWHGDTPEQILGRLDNEVSISTVRQIVREWRTGQKRQRTTERTAA